MCSYAKLTVCTPFIKNFVHLKTTVTNPTKVTVNYLVFPNNISLHQTSDRPFHAASIAWEEAYWQRYHAAQSYAKQGDYAQFREAYRTSCVAYFNLGSPSVAFADIEPHLREAYETETAPTKLPWEVARSAMRAAWDRLAGPYHEEMRA